MLDKRVDAMFDIYGKDILHFMTEKEPCNRIVFAKKKKLYFILKENLVTLFNCHAFCETVLDFGHFLPRENLFRPTNSQAVSFLLDGTTSPVLPCSR